MCRVRGMLLLFPIHPALARGESLHVCATTNDTSARSLARSIGKEFFSLSNAHVCDPRVSVDLNLIPP